MTKADLQVLLEDWKDVVLTLKVHRDTMRKDLVLVEKWEAKRKSVLDRYATLTSQERDELNAAYIEWYRSSSAIFNSGVPDSGFDGIL